MQSFLLLIHLMQTVLMGGGKFIDPDFLSEGERGNRCGENGVKPSDSPSGEKSFSCLVFFCLFCFYLKQMLIYLLIR